MSPDRQPTKKDGCQSFCTDTSVSVHGIAAGGLWHRTTARPPTSCVGDPAVLLRFAKHPAVSVTGYTGSPSFSMNQDDGA
jgi:hypothetical protein